MHYIINFYKLCQLHIILILSLAFLLGMELVSPLFAPVSILCTNTLAWALITIAAMIAGQIIDQDIDCFRLRTTLMPIPSGIIPIRHAYLLSTVLMLSGFFIFFYQQTPMICVTLAGYLIFYLGCYLPYLRLSHPMCRLFEGLLLSLAPLFGASMITQHIDLSLIDISLLLAVWFMIHRWSIEIYRQEEYKKSQIITFVSIYGIQGTKTAILLFSILLTTLSFLPYIINLAGLIYLIGACIINSILCQYSIKLYREKGRHTIYPLVKYSKAYLFMLFIIITVDHVFSMMT